MSTLATDAFTRADTSTLGANWGKASADGAWGINGNAADPQNNAADCGAYYSAVVWPNDQWSQAAITAGTVGGGSGAGVTCRYSASALTRYRCVVSQAGTNNVELGKEVAGTFTLIWDRTSAWSSGNTIRLEAQGTTLRAYKNGVQIGADSTDSSIASGNAGIIYSSTDISVVLDDWAGGDFAGAAISYDWLQPPAYPRRGPTVATPY